MSRVNFDKQYLMLVYTSMVKLYWCISDLLNVCVYKHGKIYWCQIDLLDAYILNACVYKHGEVILVYKYK